jgi:hypothetical protein
MRACRAVVAVLQDSHGNFYDCCLTLQPAVVSNTHKVQEMQSSGRLMAAWRCWQYLASMCTLRAAEYLES